MLSWLTGPNQLRFQDFHARPPLPYLVFEIWFATCVCACVCVCVCVCVCAQFLCVGVWKWTIQTPRCAFWSARQLQRRGVKPTGTWHKLTSLTAAMTTENKTENEIILYFHNDSSVSLSPPHSLSLRPDRWRSKGCGKRDRNLSLVFLLPVKFSLSLSLCSGVFFLLFFFFHLQPQMIELLHLCLSFFPLLLAWGERAWKQSSSRASLTVPA